MARCWVKYRNKRTVCVRVRRGRTRAPTLPAPCEKEPGVVSVEGEEGDGERAYEKGTTRAAASRWIFVGAAAGSYDNR